jgi:hypothetical protein
MGRFRFKGWLLPRFDSRHGRVIFELRRRDQLHDTDVVLDHWGREHVVGTLPITPPNTMYVTAVPELGDAINNLAMHFTLTDVC